MAEPRSRYVKIRPPAVAGQFYPSDVQMLQTSISRLLATAPASTTPVPKALIAPHAGYIYSGQVAAVAFTALRDIAQAISAWC
jgi:AmmeMemoRadiSam system protein B